MILVTVGTHWSLGLHRNQYTLQTWSITPDWRGAETTLNQSLPRQRDFDHGVVCPGRLEDDARTDAHQRFALRELRGVLMVRSICRTTGGPERGFPVASSPPPAPKCHWVWPLLTRSPCATVQTAACASQCRRALQRYRRPAPSITTSDPNLRPEVSDSAEISVEREWAGTG